ncbi:uncharacterized protein LOC132724124 isoform X2 [Ruditapes philippinarum]|nr:uncharacterized protein LOC132724124 isoform X2 [Ruditapes philippinarum]
MEDLDNKQILTCPVCCDTFTNTSRLLHNLDCSHSVCTTCLKKAIEGRNATCPLCKVVNELKQCDKTYISSGSSGKCPIETFGKRCTQCDESNAAIKFCEECNEFICNECTIAHKRTKLTKGHRLTDIARDEAAAEIIFEQEYCSVEQHSDCILNLYCIKCHTVICEKCAHEKHLNHQTKPLAEVVKEKNKELKSIVQEIKQNEHYKSTEILEKKTAMTKEMEEKMKLGLTIQFDSYRKVLEDRCDALKSQVENKAKTYIENTSDLLRNMQDKLKEAELLSNEKNAMTFIRSCRDTIKALKRCERNISKIPKEFELRFSQVCTTDDFEKLVNALGSIQDASNQSINIREEYDESGSFGLKSEASPALPGDSQANTQLMDVLKSLSISEQGERPFPELSYRSSKLNSTKEPRSINNETFTLQNVHSPKVVDIPKPVCLLKKNIPIGERKLLGLDSVKAMVNLRFQTWGLNGYWRIDDDSIEMFSKSQEEAGHCMQLLKETLLEKTIPLRKDSKFIVESDKWQIMTGMLRKRHQEQVQIDVNHANCEVTVYSTSMFILKDSCDIIRFFLRDNQMKTVKLRYDEPVLAFIMKHKRILKRICQSLSQYCLDISTVDETNIRMRGIGFGVGRAIQMLNSLASKYAKSTDEDRFDSDSDTDEDEEERFAEDADEAQAVEASNVTVQINLALEDDTEAAVSALCFPGDDRLLYVVAGNMIELPVEALVNAADKTLKHNGGLAKALVLKGGRSIQEECTFHVQNNGNVEIAQVFCSDAGTLRSSVIMHAVGPKWIDGNHEEKDKLFECVTNCLRSASKRKIASVAFPAISAGTYRFPIKEATLTIMKAVKDFLQQEPRCSIREIYFCDRDMNTASEFVVSMKGTFHGDDIILFGGQSLPKSAESVETGRNDKRQILFF